MDTTAFISLRRTRYARRFGEEAFLGFNLAKGRRLAFHGARSNAAIPVLLLDSKMCGELAIDAAELGTWRWDLSATEFSGYGRFCALLGLEGAPRGETRSIIGGSDFALVEPLHWLLWPRLPPNASSAAGQTASGFRFSRTIAENPGCVRRGRLADIDILKRAEAERSHVLRRLASA